VIRAPGREATADLLAEKVPAKQSANDREQERVKVR
jgi:hypothetical protein